MHAVQIHLLTTNNTRFVDLDIVTGS